jgi:hypothetical protein
MSYIDDQFQFFVDNQEKLVNKHEGKVIVLHDRKVRGAFDDYLEAYLYGKKHFEPGSFIVQKCIRGDAAYTATIPLLGATS